MTVRQFAVIATVWLVILTIWTICQQVALHNLTDNKLNKQICIQELVPIEELK